MTTCLICHADISAPLSQFGSIKNPMCSSCYLNEMSWVYEDAEMMELLTSGIECGEAMKIVLERHAEDLKKESYFELAAKEIATAFLDAFHAEAE